MKKFPAKNLIVQITKCKIKFNWNVSIREMLYLQHFHNIFTSGGATHKVGRPRPPQNLKKLIYSMYIICILKNVACKNWSWPPQILSYFNGALKRKRNYIKII